MNSAMNCSSISAPMPIAGFSTTSRMTGSGSTSKLGARLRYAAAAARISTIIARADKPRARRLHACAACAGSRRWISSSSSACSAAMRAARASLRVMRCLGTCACSGISSCIGRACAGCISSGMGGISSNSSSSSAARAASLAARRASFAAAFAAAFSRFAAALASRAAIRAARGSYSSSSSASSSKAAGSGNCCTGSSRRVWRVLGACAVCAASIRGAGAGSCGCAAVRGGSGAGRGVSLDAAGAPPSTSAMIASRSNSPLSGTSLSSSLSASRFMVSSFLSISLSVCLL